MLFKFKRPLLLSLKLIQVFLFISRFLSPVAQIQPTQRNAVIKKRIKLFFLPSAFALLFDDIGDEQDDSTELKASMSKSKVKKKVPLSQVL